MNRVFSKSVSSKKFFLPAMPDPDTARDVLAFAGSHGPEIAGAVAVLETVALVAPIP